VSCMSILVLLRLSDRTRCSVWGYGSTGKEGLLEWELRLSNVLCTSLVQQECQKLLFDDFHFVRSASTFLDVD
jgi:hypothetical protein